MDAFLRRAPGQPLPPEVATRKSSDVWDHAKVHSKSGSNRVIDCNYCDRKNWTVAATRFQQHLGHIKGQGVTVCPGVPEDVKALFAEKPAAQASTSQRQVTMGALVKPQLKAAADDAMAEFYYFNGIAFNTASSLAYKKTAAAIARAGPGYVPPTAWRLRTCLLEGCHSRVEAAVQELRGKDLRAGFSLCSDGWTDTAGHPLVNVMWSSPDGCIFLSSHAAAGDIKSAEWLAELMGKKIEEVGAANVVLVVTDNAASCKAAGKLLEDKYPHIMWVGCLAHCLDLLIKDICKLGWAEATISLGKTIVKFLKRHDKTKHLFSIHSTLQLLQPGDTRFATAITMLERVIKVKEALQLTVKDPEWAKFKKKLPTKRRAKAKRVEKAVLSKSEEGKHLWSEAGVLVAVCQPMVKLLRMADGQAPCTGEVYHFMYTLQEHIKEADMGAGSSAQRTARRRELEALLLKRWEFLHQPIYAAAYALNPQFWHHELEDVEEVMDGLREVLSQLLGPDVCNVALQEWQDFRAQRGAFSGAAAKAGARSMLPHQFWGLYGTGCKTLRPVAVRLLAQSPSASPCERNWSVYDFVHSKKRNRLGLQKAQQLVYVFQNMRTVMKHASEEKSDEYYQWAMHTKAEPTADALSDSDATESESSGADDDDDDAE